MSSQLDVHELLKREAFASASAAGDAHFEKSRPSPDETHGFSDQYVVLDSWEKDLASSIPAAGLLAWNFSVQAQTSNQSIGVRDTVENVTEIQIGSFIIPNVYPNAQTTNPWNGRTLSGYPPLSLSLDESDPTDPLSATFGWLSPYVGRVTIEMREIGLQSVSQRKGVRYHFEADVIAVFANQGTLSTALGTSVAGTVNPPPNALRIVPLPGFDTYVFTDPIQDVHGLSLQFRVVDGDLPFPQDVTVGAVAYTSPAIYPYLGFQLPVSTSSSWATLSAFVAGSVGLGRVTIEGFASADAAVNAWVTQAPSLLSRLPVGRAPGISIDRLDFAAGATITGQTVAFVPAPRINIATLVPIAPTELVAIPSAGTTTVRFTLGRVRVPLRLRRVVPRLTNYT